MFVYSPFSNQYSQWYPDTIDKYPYDWLIAD